MFNNNRTAGQYPMTTEPETEKRVWAFPALSWLVSFYFFCGFIRGVGFPPSKILSVGDALYVFLWLLFLFLPFFSRIRIGKFLELEREVSKAKEEMRDFKTDVRNSMSILSTTVNTIGRMTNQVTVNIPGLAELREARQIVEAKAPVETRQTASRVEEIIIDQSEDSTLALAKTRIDIERLLREGLGKKTSLAQGTEDPVKYAGINQLFNLFVSQHREFEYLRKPFRYVTQVCNAAIHAQRVSDDQAQEALALGAQVIAVLKELVSEP